MKIQKLGLTTPRERVSIENINEHKVYEQLYKIKGMLENYAQKNRINIGFELIQPASEIDAQKLNIIAFDNGMNFYMKKTSVSPDMKSIERVSYTKGNTKITADETFTKRVFRAVSELNQDIQNKRNTDNNSFTAVFVDYLKDAYFNKLLFM